MILVSEQHKKSPHQRAISHHTYKTVSIWKNVFAQFISEMLMMLM